MLMKMLVDWQTRFLIYQMYPKYLAGPSLRCGDTNEGLNNPSKAGCLREYSWLTGNV